LITKAVDHLILVAREAARLAESRLQSEHRNPGYGLKRESVPGARQPYFFKGLSCSNEIFGKISIKAKQPNGSSA
jgi:hypothetical protein